MDIPELGLLFVNYDFFIWFSLQLCITKDFCLIMSTNKINSIQEYHAVIGGEGILGIGGRGEGSCAGSICVGGDDVSDRGTKHHCGHDDTMIMMMKGRMTARIWLSIA